MGDVLCNVLINVFYVRLICIRLCHVTYLYRKKTKQTKTTTTKTTKKQGTKNDMKLVNVNVDLMQVFVTISKRGIMTNVNVKGKNRLEKEYVIKDLFGIQVIVNVNAINHVMLKII